MFIGLGSFLAGILLSLFQARVPAVFPLLGICLFAGVAWWVCCGVYRRLAAYLICFVLGMLWIAIYAQLVLPKPLPARYLQKRVVVVGVVDSIPKCVRRSMSFFFHINSIDKKPFSARVRLSWYGKYPVIQAGEAWVWTVRLKPAHGLQNPGGFNYKLWLLQQGVRATGYIIVKQPVELIKGKLSHPILRFRQALQNSIQKAVSSPPLAGVLAALSVGSRELLTQKDWLVFQATGTSHLIAISGLHVGLAALFAYGLMSFLWRLYTPLLEWFPAQKAASAFCILAAILYGLLAGFSLPTQRAVIMVAAIMLGRLSDHVIPLWQRLFVAFVVVVACAPFSVFSPGLWLSFAAVAWIAYGMRARLGMASKWRQWLKVQTLVCLGLLPLTLLFFQRISLVMFLANMIAIPWVSFLVVPLCLLASVSALANIALSQFLFQGAALALKPLWWILQSMSDWHGVVWYAAISHSSVFISSTIALLLFLAPRGVCGRSFCVFLALPFFFYQPPRPPHGGVKLTVLDVGQGLSALVQTQHHVLLYDAGPKSYGGFDAGESVVIPYLRTKGLRRIDMMIISHADNDHRGGANAVLSGLSVGQLLTSAKARLFKFPVIKCTAGQHWNWDGVLFQILSPFTHSRVSKNDASCVLKISAHRGSILLPGDIEKPMEEMLVKHYGSRLAATVMIAPHHGSKSSSTQDFVAAVHPKLVIFPVGFLNRYRFPASHLLLRYRDLGAALYSTAESGAITVFFDNLGKICADQHYQKAYFWQ